MATSHFGDNLKTGILAAVIFPVLLLLFLPFTREKKTENS
jgi:hypothetical protein